MDLSDAVRDVREVTDPLDRARRAGEIITAIGATQTELSAIRREAVETLLEGGRSVTDVAGLLGISRARVSQLIRTAPPPERTLLAPDGGPITVVVAGKIESGRQDPQPVVAEDDLVAYQTLADLARTMQIDIDYEVLPPGGYLRLNRSNLVVMVGPRHAPNIREALESDPNLKFALDERGWHLIDRQTGVVYRSPMDQGEPGDVAYLGRIPRPDGRGHVLYAAGIHAVGESGAMHWITDHVADLHREVRAHRFSALIGCTYDVESSPRRIVRSERLTPIYRPGGGQ